MRENRPKENWKRERRVVRGRILGEVLFWVI